MHRGPIATSDDEIHFLTLEGQAAGDSVVRVVVQDRLVVLPAVEHANNGNQIAGHVEGDHDALAVVRDAQAGPHIVAQGATPRERAQAFAVGDDCLGVTNCNVRRGRRRDVALQLGKLLFGLGRENDRVAHCSLLTEPAHARPPGGRGPDRR